MSHMPNFSTTQYALHENDVAPSNVQDWLRLTRTRLFKRLAFWVFSSIVVIEMIVLIPSVQRYEQQQLAQLQQTSAAMLPLMMQLTRYAESNQALLTEISRLQLNAVVTGGALYDARQRLIGSFGEAPNLDLLTQGIQYARTADGNRYDVVWSAQFGRNYTLVLRHDASHIRNALLTYVSHSLVFVMMTALFVTLITLSVIGLLLISPILVLRQNLFTSNEALNHHEAMPPFLSSNKAFRDEIGELATEIDRLFQQVAQATHARHCAEQTLRQRNEELNTFAHTVAHDLKNPVNAILGYGELLQAELQNLPTEQQPSSRLNYLNEVRRAALKMQEIIDALLLLAGVSKHKVELHELDMTNLVTEVEHRLAHMLQTYQGQLQKPNDWPSAKGFAPWVEEVWVNYITNALKYGGQPPIVILGATEQADKRIKFWVKDNGPGLSPEAQQRLFSAFTQSEHDIGKGHGLGLSIVQQVVHKLGGQVGVESHVGQGSVFYFTLPSFDRGEVLELGQEDEIKAV